MKAEDVNELMAKRRSVFPQFYTGEKVDDNIVRQMIVNATWAPAHKLTQPWRFVVFTGDGIQQLAKSQAEIYLDVTMRNGTFRQDKHESLLKKPLLSSHIIVVCMKRDPKASVPEIEEVGAVFCAVQNMYLTAHAYGVGCYLSTGGITYFDEARKLFGLDPEDKIIGFMHVGTPKAQPTGARRLPADEISQWISE
jgi:nitroreductase